jgi:hypothetical protein
MTITSLVRSAVAGLLLVALAACVTVTSVKPGPYKVGSTYTVTVGREWSDVSAIMVARPKHVRLLSIDGPLLNRLYLTDGIAKGGFLVKPASKEAPTPTYREGLSQTELVEFVVDSVAAIGFERPESANLRPAKFGAADGLRFEVSAKTPEGLDISGTALLAERGGKLFVILYVAPSEHYFTATLPEVDHIMSTASLR